MNKLVSVKQNKLNVDLHEDWEDYFESEELHSEEERCDVACKIRNINMDNNCKNEKCVDIASEISKLNEECVNLEKKCILIDYVKSDQLFELSDKISDFTNIINRLIDKVEMYEGDSIMDLNYERLTELEMLMIKLYKKVRNQIASIESQMIKGTYKNMDSVTKCGVCKESELNCIIRPCNHVCICQKCAEVSLKCPLCFKFIEYVDKVYLPNN